MPANNQLILFNANGLNVLTDAGLAETGWDESGIVVNEVAYSARLNALLRQINSVTYSIADLVATELAITVDSSANKLTKEIVKSALENMTLEWAADKRTVQAANTIWAGPNTGVATAPGFRALVPADIPALDTAKITSGTFGTAFITDLAVTEGKIAAGAVTVAKLGNAAVETTKIKDANVTFAKIQNSVAGLSVLGRNVNSAGSFAEISAATDHHVLRRSGTSIGFGQIVSGGIADSAVINAKINDAAVSLAKLSRSDILTSDGTKILDSLISAKHSSVIGYTGPTGTTLGQYYIRKVTQNQYDALVTPDANTIYLIVG